MAEALRYKDKVTIVTGGSKGIGRGCVEVFGKIQTYLYFNEHECTLSLYYISYGR